jgi:CHAT domain-containing protein
MKHIGSCKIFHFAGHGQSNATDPSKSCSLLNVWQSNLLTVADFRDLSLQNTAPFLGYLSACSTGANKANDLVDEGIHLVNALQLAGFRHVVGTLWEVSDRHCVDVARILYATIRDEGMKDESVCKGLHYAVRALRDRSVETGSTAILKRNVELMDYGLSGATQEDPQYWAPYIHFGV